MDLLMIFAAFCAYFVKGMCGFANTLVFSTILSFRDSNINITPIELILGYPANVIMAWRERKSLSPKIFVPLSLFILAGIIPGVFFLKNGDVRLIKVFFGLAVIFIGAEMMRSELSSGGKQKKASRIFLVSIGVISGLLCGMFGIGALLAAYVSRLAKDSGEFRANMCIVFMIENTARLLLYTFTDIMTLQAIKSAIMLYPIMFLGLAAGMFLGKYVSEKNVRRLMIIMLIFSGVSLSAESIMSFF